MLRWRDKCTSRQTRRFPYKKKAVDGIGIKIDLCLDTLPNLAVPIRIALR
jgi:hypothetical protein